MIGENLAELRQRFFGTILFIARYEHDMFAVARVRSALVDGPGITRGGAGRGGESKERAEKRCNES